MSNKVIVVILILLTLGVFGGLVYYGWTHRYGSAETYQLQEPRLLAVSYQPEEELTLKPEDVFAEIWQNVPSIGLMLMHQVTELPWPRELIPVVKVQAFHNGEDIYFKMTWQDDHADATVSLDEFTDGCAVAVPMDANAPVPSIMMGFSSPVNIWHWQADNDLQYWHNKRNESIAYTDHLYPFEDQEVLPITTPELNSAVADLLAQRAGSLTLKEAQIVQGRGQWRDGSWSVVFKRSLTTNDSQRDCQFGWGQRSASFAVWDGDQNDRGARKSISEWVNLQIEAPQPKRSAHKETSHSIIRVDGTPAAGASYTNRFFSLSLVSSAHGASVETEPAQSGVQPRIINLQAKRFQYIPHQITVQKGELVTILMESLDVTHGFYLDGYGVTMKARPGVVGKVTFVADKTGRFSFRCSETCGEFHPYMIGFLKVTPNSRFHLFVAAVCVVFVITLGILLRGARQKKGVEENAGTE